jgi:TatD DNase family protein
MQHIDALPIIDAHFHGSLCVQKGMSKESLLAELRQASFALDAGVEAGDFETRLALYDPLPPNLGFAVGIGPGSQVDRLEEELAIVREHAQHPRIVAIGEIGLDFYHMRESQEAQVRLFAAQLELAKELGLPVVIHSRHAFKATLDAIDAASPLPGVMMHCFSYGRDEAEQCIQRGFSLSFAGNLSYKSSLGLREALLACPLDAILIETDSPYLSPEPYRGIASRPSSARLTLDFAARQLGMDAHELGQRALLNAKRLFSKIEA